jgi:hypothetical protein
MTRLVKFALFLSSFAPLFLLLGIRYLANLPVAVVCLVLALVFGLGGLALVEWFRGGQDDTFIVERVESRAESLTGYLAGYLFPFLVLDPSDIYAVAATIGFGLVLSVLYVEGNLLYLNPILILRGWRIWSVEAHRQDDAKDRRTMTVIVRVRTLERDDVIKTHPLAGDVHIGEI